ncbi:MAG: hypothetical protein DI536_14065 [Archangium gephyra]|uniref:Lipoprotein n=1 Tax=Archangium gephyra TaxID=48 RepID=A0A2W5UU20_9BACT|nr:MAG: hypothetical protein DI536_14065 [Archangium gephyra]
MRKSWLLLALLLTGCNGLTPETYSLVVDSAAPSASCFNSMMDPSIVETTVPPGLMQVQVWDGPDQTSYLEVEEGGGQIDMGDAPSVAISGIFTGKKGEKGTTFTRDSVAKQTTGNAANPTVNTVTTHAEIVFERGGGTFVGTATVSSSRSCSGMGCAMNQPTCSLSGIKVSGTRIAVEYERAP